MRIRASAPSPAEPSGSSGRHPRGTSRKDQPGQARAAWRPGTLIVLKPAPDARQVRSDFWVRTDRRAHPTSRRVVNITSPQRPRGGRAALSSDPRVDMVSFTELDQHRPCGDGRKRGDHQKVFLELGGKSAFPGARRRRSGGKRVLDVGVHRLDARQAGLHRSPPG